MTLGKSGYATIDYTNWRGERSSRRIQPVYIEFRSNEWHPEMQWLLYALDIEKQAFRWFAMAGIHSWQATSPTTEPMK